MKNRLTLLADRIAAAAPIETVSVGTAADRSTWKILFSSKATSDQRAAAQAIIDAWTDDDWIPPEEKPAGKLSAIKRELARLELLRDQIAKTDALEAAAIQKDIDALIVERATMKV